MLILHGITDVEKKVVALITVHLEHRIAMGSIGAGPIDVVRRIEAEEA